MKTYHLNKISKEILTTALVALPPNPAQRKANHNVTNLNHLSQLEPSPSQNQYLNMSLDMTCQTHKINCKYSLNGTIRNSNCNHNHNHRNRNHNQNMNKMKNNHNP